LKDLIKNSQPDKISFYHRFCIQILHTNNIFLLYSDQRITQDVEKFSTAVSELYSSTFKPIVDIVLFTRRLVNSIGYGGPILMYLYYVLSGFVMRRLLPNFAKMTAKQQKLEGDFRFNHSRLLMHAEEIAFYRGWGIEKNLVRSLHKNVPIR
jgi:ABC-type uncharacterized transport system fused permease/ATPase subunit